MLLRREPLLVLGAGGWGPSCRGTFAVRSARGWRAMRQPRAPLLLLGVVLGVFVRRGCCGSFLHSLCYFYLQLPESSQGLHQFIRIYLDDQPIARYDSLTRKMDLLVPWMEEAEEETFMAPGRVFRADLEKLSKLDHQAGGLHTWQAVLGCELREDGSKRGFLRYGYNGSDFLNFEKETLTWVAAQPQAQKVKEKWEADREWSEKMKEILEKTCIEWLQRYLSYKKAALQRTEPPEGKLTRKIANDSLEVLICQAFGFYPKEIQTNWTKDREVCQYETLHRNVVPNSDGTYYVWLSIEIDPKERDHFRCHLDHDGLQEPLVLPWKEETARTWWIPLGIVAAVILALGILFLRCQRRRCRRCFHPKVTTCPDRVSPEMVPSPPIDSTDDETQSHLMPQPGTTQPTEGGGPRVLPKALFQCCKWRREATDAERMAEQLKLSLQSRPSSNQEQGKQ